MDPEATPPDDEPELAAFVGRNWESHYRDSFRAKRARRRASFNPAAALYPMWLAYRGFWLVQLVILIPGAMIAGMVAMLLPSSPGVPWLAMAVAYVVLALVEGASADSLLHTRATQAIAGVRKKGLTGDAARASLRRQGGASVIGVIMIAGAAAYAGNWLYRKTFDDHDRMYVLVMKADLRNLMSAEEAYFRDNRAFTSLALDSAAMGGRHLQTSTGVTLTMGPATATGWSATAKHASSHVVCAIFAGDATPPMRGQEEGIPKCT